MNKMNKSGSYSTFLTWFSALLLSALAVGCGGGGGSILGGGDTGGPAPQVTVVAPLPNATGVSINTKIITAAFTKTMDSATLTSATFTLACPAGTPVTGTVSYVAASSVATLTLPGATNLPPNTVCTATITTGAKDTTGIALASNFAWTFTTGATPDTTAPTVTGTINVNGATGVPVNTKVGATFSEAMDPLTITTTTFTLRQGTTAVSGAVTYSGVNAVFTPASNLAASTTYTATITTGSKDLAGNALASDFTWSWTTGAAPDTTAPTVTGTVNAGGATNVAINTRPGVTFSEAMDPLTITSANFVLTETVSGSVVPGAVSYSGVNAVFVPLVNLANSRGYTITVKSGATGVKDLAGNPMAADFVNSWTTGAAPDTTPPTVTGTVQANGATNIAVNTRVGATFSEAMDPLTITNVTFTLRETVSGTAVAGTVSYSGVTAVFVPLSNLANNRRYTATLKGGVSGAKDLAGNPLASDYVWSWTTRAAADTTAPTVIGTVNIEGATDVAVNTRPGATFSEAMDPLTITNLTLTLTETASGAVVPGTVTYVGVNAVYRPANNLNTNQGYTLTVKGGATGAKDLAGNALARDFVNKWTTLGSGPTPSTDTTPPTVTLTSPLNAATGVCINKAIAATFSEAMDLLTINNVNFTVAGVSGAVTYDGITKIATFTPDSNLAASTPYTATISTGVKDLAGNALASSKVWTFTTGITTCTTPPDLGAAAPFGTFGGGAGMTNQGILTIINGDIGTTAVSTAVTGFHDSVGDIYTQTPLNIGTVNGRIYTAPPPPAGAGVGGTAFTFGIATDAASAAQIAYDNMSPASLPGGVDPGAGQLGGLTLEPGIYMAAGGTFLLTGSDLTLDAKGDPNATWVFQTAAGLTIGAPGFPRKVLLTGGASAKNVFWYVGSAARIEDRSEMVGTIIASAGVTISTAGQGQTTTLLGRALGLNASVTVVNTIITTP